MPQLEGNEIKAVEGDLKVELNHVDVGTLVVYYFSKPFSFFFFLKLGNKRRYDEMALLS